MTDIEKLVDEFVCDLNCPLNCCLQSEGGGFIAGDYELVKRSDGKLLCDGSVFRLRDSLENCEEGIRFRQDSSGVCVFFQEQKCLLQASFGRDALPYECREYPRNVTRFMDHTDKMLDPVCPHAAELIMSADTQFWDYMTREIKPDPEGLFAKRREIILTLRDEGLSLPEALNRICSAYEPGPCCSGENPLPPEMEPIIRHLFACMLFGNLFFFGYDRRLFAGQAKLDSVVSAWMYDYLSQIPDLNRGNLPINFNRAYYDCADKSLVVKRWDFPGDITA